MKTNREKLDQLMSMVDHLSYIKPGEFPGIDLYMDQVTTFMDEYLGDSKRYPEDKILTKTMINNYAKNNLLPPPEKKKYSREHMLMLVFIYYFKSVLSISDIEQLLRPLAHHHFPKNPSIPLTKIYEDIFSMESAQRTQIKSDINEKYEKAIQEFTDADPSQKEYLQMFAFICELAFDVYMKKQMIEHLIDQMAPDLPGKKKK